MLLLKKFKNTESAQLCQNREICKNCAYLISMEKIIAIYRGWNCLTHFRKVAGRTVNKGIDPSPFIKKGSTRKCNSRAGRAEKAPKIQLADAKLHVYVVTLVRPVPIPKNLDARSTQIAQVRKFPAL